MGEEEADTLAMAPPPDKTAEATPLAAEQGRSRRRRQIAFDRTHVGAKGRPVRAHGRARDGARLPDPAGQFKDGGEQ
jgi:hypothetical protein